MKRLVYLAMMILAAILFCQCEKDSGNNKFTGDSGIFKDPRDDREYEWVQIGGQIWMAENLNYDQDSYGNDWYYGNDTSLGDVYGRLYDWPAVMQGAGSSNNNPSGIQGVCPDGWHVPSDEEWKELEIQLGMSSSQADALHGRGSNEGSKLAGQAELWKDGDLKKNEAFGASGFIALPGGDFDHNGDFECMGSFCNFYSSTEHPEWYGCAWHRSITHSNSKIHRAVLGKDIGFSVRCVKDD